MKNKKIIISALLCVMLLALFTSTVLLNQQPTTANAATDDISDLTGYSWVGNTTSPTWQDGCNINLGAKINFSINGEGSYGDLGFFGVGYDFDDNGPEYVPIYGILSLGVSRTSPGTYYSNGMIITFTGGQDVTNPMLINWLQTYGTLTEPDYTVSGKRRWVLQYNSLNEGYLPEPTFNYSLTEPVTFTSNNESFDGFYFRYTTYWDSLRYSTDLSTITVVHNGVNVSDWDDNLPFCTYAPYPYDGYFEMDFGEVEQTVSKDFYDYLMANTIPVEPEIEITDLTGYKWAGNSEGATAGFGVFDVNFFYHFRSFMQIHIGFDTIAHAVDGTILFVGYEPQLDEFTKFGYTDGDELVFIGGDDVTNPELIEFLKTYGTLTKADDSEIQTVKASRYVANRDDLNLLGAGSMSHMAFEFKSNKTNYTGISIEDTGTEAYFYYDDTIVYKQSTGWVDQRYKTIELANDQILLTPIYELFVAVYEENPIIRYKVVLNANFDGAANVEKNLTDDQTLALTLPTSWVRDGYTFQGWSTTPSGTVKYNDGETVSNLYTQDGETVNLYAVWKINTYNITFILNGEELINVKAEYNTVMQDIINNNVDILKYRAVGDIPELVKQDYAIKLESTEVGQAINNVKNNKTVQNATTIALIAIIASVALIIIKKALK